MGRRRPRRGAPLGTAAVSLLLLAQLPVARAQSDNVPALSALPTGALPAGFAEAYAHCALRNFPPRRRALYVRLLVPGWSGRALRQHGHEHVPWRARVPGR